MMTPLVSLRQTLAISQRQFAGLLGMDYSAVCRIETGSRPPTPAQLEKARQLNLLITLCQPDDNETLPPPVDEAALQAATVDLLGELRRELEQKERWVTKWQPLLTDHLRLMTLYERMLAEEGSYKPVDYVQLRGARAELQLRYRGPDAAGLAAAKAKIRALKAGIAALEKSSDAEHI